MANGRFCDGGLHQYEAQGTRRRCGKCGSVQVDLMGGQWKEDDAVKVFRSRRPTLFSLGLTELPPEPRAKAGFGRQRRG